MHPTMIDSAIRRFGIFIGQYGEWDSPFSPVRIRFGRTGFRLPDLKQFLSQPLLQRLIGKRPGQIQLIANFRAGESNVPMGSSIT